MRRAFQRATAPRRGGGAADEPSVDQAAIDAVFTGFADAEDPDWMNMEGIANLCTELTLDPETDVRVLVLCWKLQSEERPGEISRAEFVRGMQALGVDSVASLKSLLPSLDPGFMDHRRFRDFYRFCFKFNREDYQKKTLEKELVCQLLPMVIADRSPFTEAFIEFLGTASRARISADEWNSFLEFSKDVSPDLSLYEDDGAWPSLLDEFVEWSKARQ